MEVTKQDFCAPSSDGIHTLRGVVYLPKGEARGYFQVVHGMTEYIGRYDRFMKEMAEAGWITFGYDHLGHGHTVRDDSELGYIAKKNGWDYLARDVGGFFEAVRTAFPSDKKLPYCLMGHSMGSFTVRVATERYVSPDRLIVMGTGGANRAAGPGLALIALLKRIYGDRHISKLIAKLSFGSYNKRFEKELEEAPAPWLTTDASVRLKYAGDKFCTFSFTVSAMGDLIRLIKECNRAAWYRSIPAGFPVLLISGEDDPVGNYGKGVREVSALLETAGADVKCILYPGARHEILNDFTYEETVKDIRAFCEDGHEGSYQ